MLKSVRIGPKLYIGFGTILGLLLVLGITSSLQLFSVESMFSQYRTVANAAHTVGELQSNFMQARIAVKNFMVDGDAARVASATKHFEQARAANDAARAATTDPQSLALLDEIDDLLRTYEAAFLKFTDMDTRRADLEEVLTTVGPTIEAAMTAIMEQADAKANVQATYRAGVLMQHLLRARIQASKFIANSDPNSAARTLESLDDFDAASPSLLATLNDPALRREAEAALNQHKVYADTFLEIVDVIKARDTIMHGTLDVIGPTAVAQIAAYNGNAKQLRDTLGPQAVDLIEQTIFITIAIASAAVIVGVAAAWIIGSGIATPIQAMTAAMRQLANKDYTVVIPAQDHKDEVGDMAKTVQVFKDSMEEADRLAAEQAEDFKKREARATRINELNREFDSRVHGVLTAVTAATTQLQSSAESMASIAEETNAQATTVAAASEQASANVQTVAAAAEELSASISEIGRQVQRASDISQQATSEADHTNAVVSGLADAAQKIGEVVDLITDIADQTNLLALNATIEAARAGDAGKGFAVVANEVKSLAGQTAKATEDIGRQIGAVQAETKTAVSAIGGISEIINRINEVASAIAAGMEEQDAATQEIARNVQQASQGTSEVSQTIVGVTEAAREAGSAAENVLKATDSLNEQSSSLKGMVERFLADVRAA